MRLLAVLAGVQGVLLSERPITKIVKLLRTMKDKLDDDQHADDGQWKKFQCWCEKNNKEYSEAAEQAQDEIKMREARVVHNNAVAQGSAVELKQLEEEQKGTTEDLEKYRVSRQKEMEEYQKSTKELTSAVQSLKGAITVLQKHQGGQSLVSVTDMLKDKVIRHQSLFQPLLDIAQSPDGGKSFLEAPAHTQDFSSQSGGIFGILSQMLDTFTADLKETEEKEVMNKDTAQKIVAAKTAELQALNKQITTKTQVKSQAMIDATDDAGVVEKIRLSMGHDIKFLQEVKEKCPKAEEAYNERLQGRQKEQEAIGQAIDILDNDDARDLTARSVPGNTAFIQLVKQTSPKLALALQKSQLAGFEKVKTEVNKLINDLEVEQTTEQTDHDECVETANSGEQTLLKQQNEKKSLESRLELKQTKMEEVTKSLDEAKATLANTRKELVEMAKMRADENAAYQKDLQDQQDTKELLNKAIQVLRRVYESHMSFLQLGKQDPERHPTAPTEFAKAEKHGAGGSVVMQLQNVYEQTKKEIATLMRTETEAQASYLKLKDDKETAGADSQALIVKFETQTAADEETVVAVGKEIKTKVAEIMDQTKENEDNKQRCGFLVKNFTVRQQYRRDEMDALREVIAMLSGKDLKAAMDAAMPA